MADPKINDLIKERKGNEVPTSLEYFPPRTEEGVKVRVFLWLKNSSET